MGTAVLVLIWLGAQGADLSHQRTLDAWAAAHRVRLEKPVSVPLAQKFAFATDSGLGLELETRLEKARVAVGSADDSLARTELEAVEQALLSHPELAGAAWLLAERFSIEAHLLESRRDQAPEAAALRQKAVALEGPRTATFKAAASSEVAAGVARDMPPTSVATRVEGLGPGDQLEWDGKQESAQLSTALGLHQVRVIRRGSLMWAQWFNVTSDRTTLLVSTPRVTSCSSEDIGGARAERGRVVAPASSTCARWVAARPASRSSIDVAFCSRSRCEPFERWPHPAHAAVTREHAEFWPAWTPYALAGLGIAATGAVVLWRLGAFDRPEREPDRVNFTGTGALEF